MWSYSAREELHKNFTKVSKKKVPFTHFCEVLISLFPLEGAVSEFWSGERERGLPRRTRTILSQLRSSYSSHLKTFIHSISASDNPNCPDCNTELHTTNHLFKLRASLDWMYLTLVEELKMNDDCSGYNDDYHWMTDIKDFFFLII